MHDLCVQQTDTPPYAGPYLRLSPLPSGMVDFRYIDTVVADRQWQRTLMADLRILVSIARHLPRQLPLPGIERMLTDAEPL